MLSVLRRIKNVTLSGSLQGGHRLIEISFTPSVGESFVLCGLFIFVFLQQSRSELGVRGKEPPLFLFWRPFTDYHQRAASFCMNVSTLHLDCQKPA